MRTYSDAEARAVEPYVKPPTGPSNVHEPTYDRGRDCHTEPAVAFGAHDRLELEYAIDGQDRSYDSRRHVHEL
jgi:hypothetical protein